jgi:serine/threonine protein kinase
MLQPGSKFDKYTIERRLGRGGMGEIYVATNPFGAQVVLKLLHEQFATNADLVERFRREGRIQYTLRHPNIVRVTDLVEQDGVPALVVDHMSGEDLDRRLDRDGPLPVSEIIRISTALLDGLEMAHANRFIHRDLKPANIFLEDDGKGGFEPRLMDFGIAKIEEGANSLTRVNEFAGTPAYTSPEQIASTRDVTHLTDIYSFGVVMWSMCTGKEPYREISEDPYAVLRKVVDERLPALPSSVPEWLRKLIDRATEKDPSRRFPSAAAFRDALIEGASRDRYAESLAGFTSLGGDGSWASMPDGFDLSASGFDPLGSTASSPSLGSPRVVGRSPGDSILFGDESTAPDIGGGRSFSPDTFTPGTLSPSSGSSPPAEPSRIGGMMSNAEAVREATERLHASSRRRAESSEVAHELPSEPASAARIRAVERSFGRRGSQRWLKIVAGIVAAGAVLTAGILFALGYFKQPAPEGFVRIDPGTYTIGSAADEVGHRDDEVRQSVRITRPFAIAEQEVTRAEWIRLMYTPKGDFPSCGERCPVTNVTWTDAIRFANRRSLDEGLTPCYEIEGSTVTWPRGLDCEGYRLPTEAEWEIAARAGESTAVPGGDLTHTGRELLDPRLSVVAWYAANSDATYADASSCSNWGPNRTTCGPQPAGTKRANPWGLFDMHGNVAEWVWDYYAAYPGGEVTDPTGPDEGSQRVIRGGSWRDIAERCRSAARDRSTPVDRDHIGFRLARTLR